LELTAFHTGIPLAILLAELAWYAGLRRSAAISTLVWCSLGSAALAPAIQLLGVALAIALLVAGQPRQATLWLDYGLAIAVASVCIAWVELRVQPARGSALDGISGQPPTR
jgi:hypothetical protein